MQAVEVNVRVQATTVRARVSQGVGEDRSLGQLGRLGQPASSLSSRRCRFAWRRRGTICAHPGRSIASGDLGPAVATGWLLEVPSNMLANNRPGRTQRPFW